MRIPQHQPTPSPQMVDGIPNKNENKLKHKIFLYQQNFYDKINLLSSSKLKT